MSRLSSSLNAKLSPEIQAKYESVTKSASGLSATFQALFTNPRAASGLAGLHEAIGQIDLEPWVTYTVALTVAHERENIALWDSFVPLAREAGVSEAVIDGGLVPSGHVGGSMMCIRTLCLRGKSRGTSRLSTRS